MQQWFFWSVSVLVLTVNMVWLRKLSLLAAEDRGEIQKVLMLLNNIYAQMRLGTAGVDRLEVGAAAVADELTKSQARANAVTDGEPGEAADAGIRSDKVVHEGL